LCFVILTLHTKAQNEKHVWDSIKSITAPVIAPAFQNEFDAPYKQPLADYGWEDGLQISRNGLQLYALYSPMDLFSWNNFIITHSTLPLCSLFANMSYLRNYANTYGMDMVTNPFACDSFGNIDILYAHRPTINDNFTTWQLSGIARGGLIEGSPAPLASETDTSKVDLFFFTGNGDMWMIQNTTNNPTGINTAIRLATPINPDSNEFNADNPFVERISGDTIILIYEKYTDASIRTFMYVLSNDMGLTWGSPQPITTITNSGGHIEHPHLYKDNSGEWWLYFSINYTDIVRSKQTIAGNWDSWGTPQVIISKGNASSIGEPSLTKNGDISFSLAYKNTIINDSTDVYDLDPWVLPRKKTTSVNINNYEISNNQPMLKIYPNPASFSATLQTSKIVTGATLLFYNLYGQMVKQIKNVSGQTITLYFDDLPNGLYFIRLTEDNKTYTTEKLILTSE